MSVRPRAGTRHTRSVPAVEYYSAVKRLQGAVQAPARTIGPSCRRRARESSRTQTAACPPRDPAGTGVWHARTSTDKPTSGCLGASLQAGEEGAVASDCPTGAGVSSWGGARLSERGGCDGRPTPLVCTRGRGLLHVCCSLRTTRPSGGKRAFPQTGSREQGEEAPPKAVSLQRGPLGAQ